MLTRRILCRANCTKELFYKRRICGKKVCFISIFVFATFTRHVAQRTEFNGCFVLRKVDLLLCSNNLSLELKKKVIKSCIWSVAVCGSETWTVGKK